MAEKMLSKTELGALSQAARAVSKHAWSPHSGFTVGSAVMDTSGRVHVGCNVESDCYGLTQCAERAAVTAAIAAGVRPGEMLAACVYVPGPRALPPCGACRQVLAEMLSEKAPVYSVCDSDDALCWGRAELLPDAFLMKDHQSAG